MGRISLAATALLFSLSGCGEGGMTLSEAFCADVAAGLTPIQMFRSAPPGTTQYDFALNSYGRMAISCPFQLRHNEAWRGFLIGAGVDPDM